MGDRFSREFAEVKKGLLQMIATRGSPVVYAVDANFGNRGELLLAHRHEGLDIQLDWASVTLMNLVAMWGRPVHLQTLVDGKPMLLSHDGTGVTRSVRDRGRARRRRGHRPVSTLDEALDELDGAGVVEVDRVRRHDQGGRGQGGQPGREDPEPGGRTCPIAAAADGSPGARRDRVRAIPGKLKAIEVDEKLGGAVLRTDPETMRRGRFFEFDAKRESTGVRRYRVTDGERTSEDFTLTRDQLRDLVDEIRGDEPQ